MRTTRLVLFAVVTLAIGLACNRPPADGPVQTRPSTTASPQTAAAADEFAATRAIFKEHCVQCHGENAAGGRVQVEGREIKVPNLTGEHARKPTDERIAAKISDGDDEMPAFKDKLTPQQIQDLVKFIRKEFQGR
ncbi:MAG TPA: cytochrome c [Pyrinomonadaceae bacterium]|nr:cytochrome c [Pyrinomonadaceae bacterium]